MGHGHRRRFHSDIDLVLDWPESPDSLHDVDAVVAELLAPPPLVFAGTVRTEYPVGYHHFPRFGSDDEAEDARLARSWDPDDYRIRRLLDPGDPDGPRPRLTGRSSGGGRRRERKTVAIDAPAGGQGGGERNLSDSRFRVYGLTRGEAEFFFRRPGEARAQLMQIAAFIIIEKRRPDRKAGLIRSGAQRLNFDVYGLSREQTVALRALPGVALEGLVGYAHEHDHARIILRDQAVASAA